MSLRDWLIPDEFQSASAAGASLFSAASMTSHFWLKQFVGLAIPFGAGIAVGALVLDRLIQPTEMADFREVVVGMLTFVSVLAGFMVTLMLFTGRMDGAKMLTARETPGYVDKVTYLLFSQAITLAVHIACAAACLMWLVLDAVNSDQRIVTLMFFVSFGFLAVSMARSLLLPLQIYEVHQFEFRALIDQKNTERDQLLAQERKENPGVDLIPRA